MTKAAAHSLVAAFGHLVARVWRNAKNRQSAGDLQFLTDAQLQDIGLTRADVRRALALPTHADPTVYLKEMARQHYLPKSAETEAVRFTQPSSTLVSENTWSGCGQLAA